jgi:hypothetical protein
MSRTNNCSGTKFEVGSCIEPGKGACTSKEVLDGDQTIIQSQNFCIITEILPSNIMEYPRREERAQGFYCALPATQKFSLSIRLSKICRDTQRLNIAAIVVQFWTRTRSTICSVQSELSETILLSEHFNIVFKLTPVTS